MARGVVTRDTQALQSSSGNRGIPNETLHSHFPQLHLLYTNTTQFPDSNQPQVWSSLWETVKAPKSWLLQLQLQVIYRVATNHGALFSATPLLQYVIKEYFMKANRQVNNSKSLSVSLVSVAQLHADDDTENCWQNRTNSFPWRTSKHLGHRQV